MKSILFLGYSRLVQRKLILAAKLAGFDHIEVSSRRSIQGIPNVDVIHEGYERALENSDSNLVYVSMVNSVYTVYMVYMVYMASMVYGVILQTSPRCRAW
mgnify:CR=1 FL=1